MGSTSMHELAVGHCADGMKAGRSMANAPPAKSPSSTIARRLSTVRRADRIVVLDQGTAVECGTHEFLPARDGAYARLVRKAA